MRLKLSSRQPFNGSVFLLTGAMPFSAWYSTLKLLMSSYFSWALVAWLLLFSCLM